jgi:hypothetical protein
VQAQAALQDIEVGALAGDDWDGLPYRVDMDERGEVCIQFILIHTL